MVKLDILRPEGGAEVHDTRDIQTTRLRGQGDRSQRLGRNGRNGRQGVSLRWIERARDELYEFTTPASLNSGRRRGDITHSGVVSPIWTFDWVVIGRVSGPVPLSSKTQSRAWIGAALPRAWTTLHLDQSTWTYLAASCVISWRYWVSDGARNSGAPKILVQALAGHLNAVSRRFSRHRPGHRLWIWFARSTTMRIEIEDGGLDHG